MLLLRKRGSEEMGPPDDPSLTQNDELVGLSEMAVIFMSLGVAPANFKVAELFCRTRFADAAVSVGFERGLAVHYATGWDMPFVTKSHCCWLVLRCAGPSAP